MLKRFLPVALFVLFAAALCAAPPDPALPPPKIDPVPKPLASDKTVKIDYDIVYVRAPRYVMRDGKERPSRWPEIAHPTNIDAGYDLMLLHPDGTEERLVEGGKGSVADPYVSFDGEWVYYAYFYLGDLGTGSDIYKIHVKTKKVVRLTFQEATPNTGCFTNAKSEPRVESKDVKDRAFVVSARMDGERTVVRVEKKEVALDKIAAEMKAVMTATGRKVLALDIERNVPWGVETAILDAAKGNKVAEIINPQIGRGVWNLGPCPLPGGRVAFTSTRDQVKVPRGYPKTANQLFTMDADGANVEKIGHINIGSALHPVILKDGRVIFSTLESQGVHGSIAWGIWSIHPDGTNWNPVVSALYGSGGADDGFHFQSQLSDGSIIVELYYNQNTQGFGTYFKMPPAAPEGVPAFGSARNEAVVTKEHGWEVPKLYMRGRGTMHMPFQPYGFEVLTRFTHGSDSPAPPSDLNDPKSVRVGKLTHPCGAPDNHLLTVWSSGSMPSANRGPVPYDDPLDTGLYLIKGGKTVDEPGQMLVIKNDPKYNEQWPRPLVPYERVYGVKEPKRLAALQNDGKRSKHLPEGTPFGLVGTSSMYKRESFPRGAVPKGSVTATGDPYAAFSYSMSSPYNWGGQGADAGLYSNSDIHAIRILAMEPATQPVAGRFYNHAWERLRILGEIPVRKFGVDGKQPTDPDGNPDTSFLAKIPADVAFTFQTIDKDGMVLNMAQTWHQVRPGEVRNNCGGCHAHSQQPTDFNLTAASKAEYAIFDLTKQTPLLTTKDKDESKKQWDTGDTTGIRFDKTVKDVEYHRDIKPLFARSCLACHSVKSEKPAGGLVLDDDKLVEGPRWDLGNAGPLPASYNAIAAHYIGAGKYVRGFQSRRSPLIWKVFGKRLDGFPAEPEKGKEGIHKQILAQGDFKGSIMPPPEAVKSGKVAALSDEDRRTLIRWVDLGAPIDKTFDPKKPDDRGTGWLFDDQRPTLALTSPAPGTNAKLSRILLGMHDYGTGLDPASFTVTADFDIPNVKRGENLASKFKPTGDGIWEWTLPQPIAALPTGTLTVSVKDKQGNRTEIVRKFSVK